MSGTVEILPEFKFDALDEAEYLEAQAPGLGAQFLDAIDAAVELISLAPLEQPPWLQEGIPPRRSLDEGGQIQREGRLCC